MARVMEQQSGELHGRAGTAQDTSQRLLQLTQLVEVFRELAKKRNLC